MIETLYYHLSKVNRNGQIFLPRIPPDAKYASSIEDDTIKRICCAPTIQGCLQASGSTKTRQAIFYVHKVIVNDDAKIISNQDIIKNKYVYDAKVTGETWICSPVMLKCVGVIKISHIGELVKHNTKIKYGKEYIFHIRDYQYVHLDMNEIKVKYSKFYKEELPVEEFTHEIYQIPWLAKGMKTIETGKTVVIKA